MNGVTNTVAEKFSYEPYENLSSGEKAILNVHAYVVFFAYIVLTCGGIYAGVIAPFFTHVLKLKSFQSGYLHRSYRVTIVFSAVIGLGLLALSLGWWAANSVDVGFFEQLWQWADYWRTNRRFPIDPLLFWYIYCYIGFNCLLYIAFAIVVRWKPIAPPTEKVSNRHAFVIVSHNSTKKLPATIEAILKFAIPNQIYIADNGSSDKEIDSTDRMCASYSTPEGGSINVCHIKYGNKTLAQYSCIYALDRLLKDGKSPVDIVTIIDDDVIIPANFPATQIEKEFEDPSKVVVAYPLSAENHNDTVWAAMQEVEYMGANLARKVQKMLGSQLFASGAIATWKVPQLKPVLERHCSAFNGEDLEMGYVLHKLSDGKTYKLGVDGPVRIGFIEQCNVATIVPHHLVHWYDLIPAPLKKKIKPKTCFCGEHSLFNQRVRSWDPAGHQFLFKFLQIIFSRRGTRYGPKTFIRVLCAWMVINNFREYLLIVGILQNLLGIRSVYDLVNFVVFQGETLLLSWALGVVVGSTHSANVAQQNMRFRPDIIFSCPFMFSFPYGLIIRPISTVYSLTYYIFFQRFPKQVRQQLEENKEMKDVLQTVWLKATPTSDNQGYATAPRISTVNNLPSLGVPLETPTLRPVIEEQDETKETEYLAIPAVNADVVKHETLRRRPTASRTRKYSTKSTRSRKTSARSDKGAIEIVASSSAAPPMPTAPNVLNRRGLWVWYNEKLLGRSDEQMKFVHECGRASVTDVFLFLNLEQYEAQMNDIRSFILNLSSVNIRVWGLDGGRCYFSDVDGPERLFSTVKALIHYNSSVEPEARFAGFQTDNEPADHRGEFPDSFHNDIPLSKLDTKGNGLWQKTEYEDRQAILTDWLEIQDQVNQLLWSAGLRSTASLPTWIEEYYDAPLEATFRGEKRTMMEHFLDMLDECYLMSYRTDLSKLIVQTKSIFDYAQLSNTPSKLFVGVETVRGGGMTISYGDHPEKNSKFRVLKDLEQLEIVFNSFNCFGGTNIHDWEGWKALP